MQNMIKSTTVKLSMSMIFYLPGWFGQSAEPRHFSQEILNWLTMLRVQEAVLSYCWAPTKEKSR